LKVYPYIRALATETQGHRVTWTPRIDERRSRRPRFSSCCFELQLRQRRQQHLESERRKLLQLQFK